MNKVESMTERQRLILAAVQANPGHTANWYHTQVNSMGFKSDTYRVIWDLAARRILQPWNTRTRTTWQVVQH